MAGQRIAYFDNLKGILIFLVVLGHFLTYLPVMSDSHLLRTIVVFIYSFHMPLFIFVSGLFAAKTCTAEKGFKGENVLFYLSLYLIFCLAKSLEQLAWGSGFHFNPLVQGAAPWYLLVMTTYALLTPLLRRLKPSVAMALLLLGALAGMYCINMDTRSFLACARTLAYAPIFAAGFYIGAGKMAEVLEKVQSHPRFNLMRIGALVLLVLFFLVLYFMPEHLATGVKRISTGQNTALTMGKSFPLPAVCFGLARLLFYAMVAVIGTAVMLVTPRRQCILTIWGERSLQVYIVHILIIYALAHFGFDSYMLSLTPLWKWSPFFMAPLLTALLAAPHFPLTWTAALKRLCAKAVNQDPQRDQASR